MKSTQFYCLYIRTGSENDFIKEIQSVLDSPDTPCTGKLYSLSKQMRLKNGKQYVSTIFPGYVFWETDSLDGFRLLKKGKGFVRFLPESKSPLVLSDKDVNLIKSFLNYGTILPIVHVTFDVNDRIQIIDGPFVGQEGLVKAVNRRNKRVNFEVELINGIRVIGLTYEEVQKIDNEQNLQ